MALFSRLYKVSTAGTSLVCDGLDGDRFGKLRVTWDFIFETPSATGTVVMEPNADSASLVSTLSTNHGGVVANTTWQVSDQTYSAATLDAFSSGEATVFSARTISGATDFIRFQSYSTILRSDGTGRNHYFANGIYTDRSANLTSIEFVSASPNFGVGSWVFIEQLIPDNSLL